MTGYPRDLVGYADQPPDPRWPGGARLALNFVVNYEEGGERSVLHGDKVAETQRRGTISVNPRDHSRPAPTYRKFVPRLPDGNQAKKRVTRFRRRSSLTRAIPGSRSSHWTLRWREVDLNSSSLPG